MSFVASMAEQTAATLLMMFLLRSSTVCLLFTNTLTASKLQWKMLGRVVSGDQGNHSKLLHGLQLFIFGLL
jgi:hypothetical protein